MTPTKLLVGQMLVVFAIVLAGAWTSTQWAAAALAYQPELCPPWLLAFGHPGNHRWALFGWWFSFDAYGQSEPLAGLVPHMLTASVASDREFAKGRERLAAGNG